MEIAFSNVAGSLSSWFFVYLFRMLSRLRKIFSASATTVLAEAPAGSGVVTWAGESFDFAAHAHWEEGIAHPDWDKVYAWIDTLPTENQSAVWLDCERTWLNWLRASIGLRYQLHESDVAFLLTTQPARMAQVKLAYMGTTLRRIERVLEDVANPEKGGKEILIAFENEEDYYRYVSGFYPEKGEFAMSAGMHLNTGCGHFVTHGVKLEELEPTIVHEMAHSCLSHLPIPLWLNEGMAVTVERVFAPYGEHPSHAAEIRRKHRSFWTPDLIQEFWSGRSYERTDDGRELSYDLGRVLVDALSKDWAMYKCFVLNANWHDGGLAAATEYLGIDLGEFVRMFLDQDVSCAWGPDQTRWSTT